MSNDEHHSLGSILESVEAIATAQPAPDWLVAQLAGKAEFLAARHPSGKSWPSKAEFWAEFTEDEKIGILTGPLRSVRLLDKELTMWTGSIRATDPRIVGGLAALETAGILTHARLLEIAAP